MAKNPQYRIQIRDHSLVPVGELTDYIDGDLVLNFNDVGSFTFTVRAKGNPMAQYLAEGYGVIVSRDRGDGSGAQTLLSGPFWHLERRLKDDVYILAGPDDMWWLKARQAWPDVGNTYALQIATDTPLIFLRMGDASGPTVTDSSGHGTNGTAHSGVTFGATGGIDDTDTALAFDGTVNAWVGMPSPAIASGSWYIHGWVYLTGPGSLGATNFAAICGYDSNHRIIMNTVTGQLIASHSGGNFSSVGTPAIGAWHHVAYVYDAGANLEYWYIDGAVDQAGHTPATTPVWNSAFDIGTYGVNVAGTNYAWLGSIDEFVMDTGTLSALRIAAIYANGLLRAAWQAYDTRVGAGSTVMRGYVNDNAGPGALPVRRVAGLALDADPVLGSSVTGNARDDVLLAFLQQLAISAGGLGFRVIQTDNGVLTFSIYQPATKSNAIFSVDLHNLRDAIYMIDGPDANYTKVAGGGELTARAFVERTDPTSISTWGRVEGYVDSRDTSDRPTMQQRGDAELAQSKQQTNLTITPQDTDALQYGRDYNLGDVVQVHIDGATITDVVRTIHIELNDTDQEVVSPGIGNAGSGQVAWLFSAKQRAQAAVAQRLHNLQTRF